MKPVSTGLAVAIAALLALPVAEAEARNDSGLYRNLISKYCKGVNLDRAQRFHAPSGFMPPSSIQIRSVRSIGGGWVQVRGAGYVSLVGRSATGWMEYHARSGRVVCPEGSWVYRPDILPLKNR